MEELNVEAINEFLQAEHDDQFKTALKTKCLAADAALKEAVASREEAVEEANKLQEKLNTLGSEIVRLNGVMQGQVELIDELVGTATSEG